MAETNNFVLTIILLIVVALCIQTLRDKQRIIPGGEPRGLATNQWAKDRYYEQYQANTQALQVEDGKPFKLNKEQWQALLELLPSTPGAPPHNDNLSPYSKGEGEDAELGPKRRIQAHYVHRSKRPLNLLFFISPVPHREGGTISEGLWIRDAVLSLVERPIVVKVVDYQDRMETFIDDCLIVALFMDVRAYLTKAREKGIKNIGIYHMGDEGYGEQLDWYSMADYVFRNYYDKSHHKKYPNSYWLPGGIRSGVGGHAGFIPSTMPLASQRKHHCNFLGSIRADRQEMMDVLKKTNLTCLSKVGEWESKDMEHPILYRFTLETSRFTLCPWGHNPDTMRFYESLEVGSIPIIRYFPNKDRDPHLILGDNPIPKVNSWQELPAILKEYEDPVKVDQLQKEVVTWWLGRRHRLFQMVANVIDKSFKKHYADK